MNKDKLLTHIEKQDCTLHSLLSPAKVNTEINRATLNRLRPEKGDFCEFLKLISEDCKLGKVKSQYDVV